MGWIDKLLGRKPKAAEEMPERREPGESPADRAAERVDEVRDENILGAPREPPPPGTS